MKKHFGSIRIALQLGAGALFVAGGLANLPVTLLIILVTTVLAGPFFCGWVCPFGTLQDLVSRLTKAIPKYKMPKGVQKVFVSARYLLMAVTTGLTFDFIFNLLAYDPRINFLSLLDGKWLTMGAYIVLALYLVAAIFFERPFCNYMCPQGAKYGMMSTLRPFRIVRDSNQCVNCGKCNQVCPMNIDIMNHNNVKSLQCINCMSCVSACPKKGALRFGILKLNPRSAAAYFLAVSAILATSTVAMALQFTANQGTEHVVGNEVIASHQEENASTNLTTGTQTSAVAAAEAAGIADGTYTGQGQGFKGMVTVAVTVKEEQIVSVAVLDNNDDRKWFNRAANRIPGWIVDAQSTDVDTVSGATYSSIGIINGAKDALNNAK